MKTIIDQMLNRYSEFTKSERKIVDYILEHKSDVQYLSITDLSTVCKVSISTLSVFCRKLGAEGFNVFKLELAKATMPQMPVSMPNSFGNLCAGDTLEQVVEKTFVANQGSLQKTYQRLDKEKISKAVDILRDSERVLCLGQGNHSIIAKAAWARFSTVSPRFYTTDDSHLQALAAATMTKKDVLLFFSYSGATHDFIELAHMLRSLGVKIILVTGFPHSPGSELSDLVLLIGADEQPLSYGSVGAMISQMLVIDILYNEFCRRDFEHAEHTRDFVGKILAKKCM